VYIIQAIDRKIDLEDICEAKGMDMEDLLDEIEAIVNSGTKLNLDYYINGIIEDDRQQDIYNISAKKPRLNPLKTHQGSGHRGLQRRRNQADAHQIYFRDGELMLRLRHLRYPTQPSPGSKTSKDGSPRFHIIQNSLSRS
jgi:hypothetical protein